MALGTGTVQPYLQTISNHIDLSHCCCFLQKRRSHLKCVEFISFLWTALPVYLFHLHMERDTFSVFTTYQAHE